jgi:hypothetical protein
MGATPRQGLRQRRIIGQAIQPGEDLTERQVNERLLNYTDDVVLLRRYLVDFGLLERTASVSSYRRPDSGSSGRHSAGWDSRHCCTHPRQPDVGPKAFQESRAPGRAWRIACGTSCVR